MESTIQWDIHIAHTHNPYSIIVRKENPLAQTTAREKHKNLLFFTYCPHNINDVNNGTDYIDGWAHAQFVSIYISLFAKLEVLSDKLFLESYTSIQKCEGTIQGAEPSLRILLAWQWIWFNTVNRYIIAMLEV